MKVSAAAQNRFVDLHGNDDLELRALNSEKGALPEPLHLICCAANDFGGGTLRLSRPVRAVQCSRR